MDSPIASTNSDDSQLIIDEPPMEIDSDDTEEYFDSDVHTAKYIPSKSVSLNVSPKTVTSPRIEMATQKSEIPVAVVAPSTSNKEKSAIAKPKRVAHTHCFKLTNLMDADSNRLCVSVFFCR